MHLTGVWPVQYGGVGEEKDAAPNALQNATEDIAGVVATPSNTPIIRNKCIPKPI